MARRLLTAMALAALVGACGNEVSMPFPAADDRTAPANGGDADAPPGDADTQAPPPAGDSDTPPDDQDPPLPATVPVFVAQGHAGRLLMSCDDGRTWIHDQNDEPTVICFEPTDCDHRATSAAGITYADGWFFASFGHGSAEGTLRRSSDAVTWQPMQTGDSQGGVVFHDGLLLWMQGQFGISDDLGVHVAGNLAHVPGGYYLARTIAASEDVIVASGDDPGGLVSRDNGQTWVAASLTDVAWGRNVLMATAPDGSLVTVSAVHNAQYLGSTYATVAYAARSTDGGLTWVGSASPLYVGSDYADWVTMFAEADTLVGFFDGARWTSNDGIVWTSTPVPQLPSGPIARGPSGTYVAISNVWANYYAKQRAYRSDDGITWTTLEPSRFTGGHPVHHIISGYVARAVCD